MNTKPVDIPVEHGVQLRRLTPRHRVTDLKALAQRVGELERIILKLHGEHDPIPPYK